MSVRTDRINAISQVIAKLQALEANATASADKIRYANAILVQQQALAAVQSRS